MSSSVSEVKGTVEIRSDRLRLFGLLLGAMLATGFAGLIVFHKVGDFSNTSLAYLASCFAFVFCGMCILAIGWRVLHSGEVMIRLSPDDIWIRSHGEGLTVPWKFITGTSRVSWYRQTFIVLNISDENYETLQRGAVLSSFHKLNQLLNVNGIPVMASGTSVTIDKLESMISEYLH